MAVIFVAMLAFAFPRTSSSQDASGPNGAGSGVTLVKITYPIYPDVAAKAHISGEVVLMLGIQPDGSLVSADVVSGPAMLQESAVQSARQSKYECRGCGQGVTSYRMRYVFILVDDGSCQPNAIPSANGDRQDQPEPPPSVDPSGPVVTTTRYIVCLVDPVTTIHTRSLKCLFFGDAALGASNEQNRRQDAGATNNLPRTIEADWQPCAKHLRRARPISQARLTVDLGALSAAPLRNRRLMARFRQATAPGPPRRTPAKPDANGTTSPSICAGRCMLRPYEGTIPSPAKPAHSLLFIGATFWRRLGLTYWIWRRDFVSADGWTRIILL